MPRPRSPTALAANSSAVRREGAPRSLRTALRVAALSTGLLACLACLGCASSTFDGTIYRQEAFAFRIGPLPAGWEPLRATGAALAFRDPGHEATIALSGRCRTDGDDVPLASLTQHLFLRFTEQTQVQQETVPFDGREALHTVMAAKLDGVPLQFSVWVLKKDGCVYDLYYLAPPERYAGGVGAFEQFVQRFATVPPDGH